MSDIVKRIIIQLEDETLAQLDDAASEADESRSAFIREAVETALAERLRRKELEQVVESFRKKPPEDLTISKAAMRRAWPR